jgi:hypothetical protein
VDNSGNVHVVWEDSTPLYSSGGDKDIFYTKYSSNTAQWSQISVISDSDLNWNKNGSSEPAIDVDISGNVHIVWRDSTNLENSGTDNDIFYIKGNYQTNTEEGPFIPGFSLNLVKPLIGITLSVIIYKYKKRV